GDESRVGSASDLEEEAAQTHQTEAKPLVAAGAQEPDHEQRLEHPRGQDQGLAPDIVGNMTAQVTGSHPDQRADEVREPDGRLIGSELPDRPQAAEGPDHAPGNRADPTAAEQWAGPSVG